MIGDEEAVPILRQVAVFDITAEVRDAAEAMLTRWAAAGAGVRAERARDALTEIARKRAGWSWPAAVRRRRHARRSVDRGRASARRRDAKLEVGRRARILAQKAGVTTPYSCEVWCRIAVAEP